MNSINETLKRVLIVDDVEDILYLLQTVLEFQNFEVTAFKEGFGALEELGKKPYDLMIVDYMMDGIDGLKVIDKIRNEMKLDRLKIILLTFKDLTEDEVLSLSKNNVSYLKKPFSPDELIKKIHAISD